MCSSDLRGRERERVWGWMDRLWKWCTAANGMSILKKSKNSVTIPSALVLRNCFLFLFFFFLHQVHYRWAWISELSGHCWHIASFFKLYFFCVYWQWFAKVFPSPSGDICHISILVLMKCLLRDRRSWAFSCGFWPCPLCTKILQIPSKVLMTLYTTQGKKPKILSIDHWGMLSLKCWIICCNILW